jgi:hypothetical protein
MRRASGTSGSRSIIPRWTSTAQRAASTAKIGQQAIAGVLHYPAVVFLDLRINELPEMSFEPLVCPLLIRAHQTRISGHVGGKDGGETADRGHFWPGDRLV